MDHGDDAVDRRRRGDGQLEEFPGRPENEFKYRAVGVEARRAG